MIEKKQQLGLKRGLVAGLAGLALCMIPQTAKADVSDVMDSAWSAISSGFDYIWPEHRELEDFEIRLGLGTGVMPDYEGSNNYSWKVVPLIDIRFKNVWAIQGTKFRVNVVKHKNIKFGPQLKYKSGRGENKNPILEGMGSIGATLEAGIFTEIKSKYVIFNADLRQSFGSGQGSVLILLLAHGIYQKDDFSLGMGYRFKWGSKGHNYTNFGINDTQSTATGLDAFTPGAGFNNGSANLIGRYHLNLHARLEGLISMGLMLGGSGRSPLVAIEGDKFQLATGVGFRVTF
jgi:outer membrane scaffolding protein for murein synthesis (MipA/OmpV family)